MHVKEQEIGNYFAYVSVDSTAHYCKVIVKQVRMEPNMRSIRRKGKECMWTEESNYTLRLEESGDRLVSGSVGLVAKMI